MRRRVGGPLSHGDRVSGRLGVQISSQVLGRRSVERGTPGVFGLQWKLKEEEEEGHGKGNCR